MKKGKSVLFWFVFFVLLAAVAAFVGWVEFSVPADSYGVLDTKTSGVLPRVYEAGRLDWAWQKLIPRNAEVLVFPKAAVSYGHTISGTLPSGELYAKQADSTVLPDFSYSFTFDITVKTKPASLLTLVSGGLRRAEDLEAHLDSRAAEIAQAAARYLVTNAPGDGASFLREVTDSDALVSALAPDFPDLEIVAIRTEKVRMPDIALYDRLKAAYASYRLAVDDAVKAAAREQAASIVRSNAALDRMERIGELFAKYPALAEVFSKTGDLNASLKAFNLSE